LDVGADPHLLGGPDEYGYMPAGDGGEQAGLLEVVAGFVHDLDGHGGDTEGSDLRAELLVDAPLSAAFRGAEVAEHELKRPRRPERAGSSPR
jgi:hypothetical protein